MFSKRLFLAIAFSITFLVGQVSAQNVILLPGAAGSGDTVDVFTGDPFGSMTSVSVSSSSFLALSNAAGTRYFVLSGSGTDTLVVLDESFAILQRFDLGFGATSAAMTPDGDRLLVAAGALRVFDTTQASISEISLSSPLNVGANPIDVAVAHDSSRAFVLSSASRRLTAVDLNTFSVAGSVAIPGLSTGVVVAPSGLIYVSAQNGIYEVDGRTMAAAVRIPVTGLISKLVFTPDGAHALAANQTPVAGGTSVLFIDLANRTLVASFGNFGDVVDKIVPVSNSRAFALSKTSGRLFLITFSPFNMDEASFTNLSGKEFSDVRSAVASDELPNAKFLYVATDFKVTRINLSTNLVSGQLGVLNPPGAADFAGAAATGPPASVLQFGNNQAISPGETTLPLVVRVLGTGGRPLYNVPVVFNTTAEGVTIHGGTSATDPQGFAQAAVTVGNITGNITVDADIAGGALTAPFVITVGSGGPGGTGGIFIVSGNGQVVRESFPGPEPLKVIVRGSDGAPLSGATVVFDITEGLGTLTAGTDCSVAGSGLHVTAETDEDGFACASFVASGLGGGASFVQNTVTASAEGSSVEFSVVSVLALLPGGGTAPDPLVTLIIPPVGNREISGQAGQTLPGAIKVSVIAQAGPQSAQPIPGVGLSVTTGLDPSLSPSASCAGGIVLTDASGIATCDLVLGGKVGDATLTVVTGSFNQQGPIDLHVTPGQPATIQIVQGDSQSGTPGQQLPVALVARILDAGGNPLPGMPAQWEVPVPGTVTLSSIVSVSDSSGRVSAVAKLGNTTGTVQVRVRAGSAVGVFNLTVNVLVAQLQKVSGDNQTAVVNEAFAQPLVVQLKDPQGAPVPGAPVTFAVASGAATLGTPSATSDGQGRTSTTVTAGSTAGAIVVTATSGSLSISFNLTAIPPGPIVTLAGIRNGISGDPGVSPGGIIAILGDGLAPGIQGSIVANNNLIGMLPTTLANVQVLFGTTMAPIYSVNNINGQQSVIVQAPFSLTAPGTVPVTIKVGGGSTTIENVPVKSFQPGIFETQGSGGQTFSVVLKEDGSFVTPDNPAARGSHVRMFCAGLGQTSPATGTNLAGIPGQSVLSRIVVGVNNAGVKVVSAETVEGLVGVYLVEFEIPADTTPGSDRPLAVAVSPGGDILVFGNPSKIAIQ